MPIVHIETEPGIWNTRTLTHEERRAVLITSRPEQRFIEDDEVFIAHPSNLWCMISGDGYEHISWEDQ